MSEKTKRLPGEMLVAVSLMAGAVFLALTFNTQIKWFDNMPLHNQPGLWPLVSVAGMVFTGAIALFQLFRQSASTGSTSEYAMWFRAIEYPVWFMIYVLCVPYIGYLLASILFAGLLTCRVGYRSVRGFLSGAGFGVCVVLLFKTFLKVNVPGGAIYKMLPAPFNSFMLTLF